MLAKGRVGDGMQGLNGHQNNPQRTALSSALGNPSSDSLKSSFSTNSFAHSHREYKHNAFKSPIKQTLLQLTNMFVIVVP